MKFKFFSNNQRYKRLYLLAIIGFAAINIASVFLVFKKYKCDFRTSTTVSSTKSKYSNLQEKLEILSDSAILNKNELELTELNLLTSQLFAMDSILVKDNIADADLQDINSKLYEYSAKGNEIENQLFDGSNRSN
ncbi:MAG: hypothetical protein ACOVP5_05850 [Chitinophagales bacterium]